MINFNEIELDEILDQRENPMFDREWNRVYRHVEELKKGTVIHESKKIQKRVFISVFERSMSDELAGYICDDFGLIAESKAVGFSDAWLDKLIACYERAVVPCGKL